VALESAGSEKARTSLFSTIHGAGRVLGRKDASVGSPAPKWMRGSASAA